MGKKEERKEPKKQSEVSKAAKGFFYGMALHGMVTYALRLRMHMENLFMLITMGDMLGYLYYRPTTASGSYPTRSRL